MNAIFKRNNILSVYFYQYIFERSLMHKIGRPVNTCMKAASANKALRELSA